MKTGEWNVARRRLAPAAVAMGTAMLVMLLPEPAEACSCLSATVESSHFNSSDAATLTPLVGHRIGNERWYVAQVAKPYKGCIDAGDLVLLVTPSSSASCGARLELGVEYLIHGDRRGSLFGLPRLAFNACDYNLPVVELSDHDRAFLAGRQVCCGDECSCADGSEPVQCFADPCEAAAACSEAVTCEANYCGGCNAEFYDASGYGVCQAESECHEAGCSSVPPGCTSDDECAPTGCSGQICAAEAVLTTCEFRPEYACFQDPAITSCGCSDGQCAFVQTPELAVCLEAATGGPQPSSGP
jgi:eight-cysteine-cluster-containing protein